MGSVEDNVAKGREPLRNSHDRQGMLRGQRGLCAGFMPLPSSSFVEVSLLRPASSLLLWLAHSCPQRAFRLSLHMLWALAGWGAQGPQQGPSPFSQCGLTSWQGHGQTIGHQPGRTGLLGVSLWPEGCGGR